VATLSEEECRSAFEETLGAKGSWTWTMSGAEVRRTFLTWSPTPAIVT
jgi:hypothetical protein